METAEYGYNDTVSTASETGLMFLEVLITKMVDNSAAANISNDADSAAATQGHTYGILVTDKKISGVEIHKISTTLEACNIPITLEIYNIPGNILEVCNISTTDNTLEVLISHSRKYAGGIQYSKHKG